jgi:transposase
MDLQSRISILKHYYKENESAAAALRAYKTEKGLKSDPFSLSTITRLIQRFEETGSVADRPHTGRRKDE